MRLSSMTNRAALAASVAASLTFSACHEDCEEDGSCAQNNQDLGALDLAQGPDLRMPTDGAVPPDLQPPALGGGLMMIADVSGTYPALTDHGLALMSNTHIVLPWHSLPVNDVAPQYIDPDYSAVPGALHGCIANRFDRQKGPLPPDDDSVGGTVFAGYNAQLRALERSMSFGVAIDPPMPTSIHCKVGGPSLPFNGCTFGLDAPDAGARYDLTDVIFPPADAVNGACSLPGQTIILPDRLLCEQHPFIPATTTIVEAINGGGTYGAIARPVPAQGALSPPVTVLKVNGDLPFTTSDPLYGILLDPGSDLTITWNCDASGASVTPGASCPSGVAGATALVGLIAVATTAPTLDFQITDQFGSVLCVEQAGAPGATLTLHKEAIATLYDAQVGGSVLLALVRLDANLGSTNGHQVVFAAGAGNFALLGTRPE